MTVNDVYSHLGEKIINAIPPNISNWEKSIMTVHRQEGYIATGAIVIVNGNIIPLDDLDAGFYTSQYIHELHTITTEGGHNRWNKLEFTLFPDGKFDLQFIWDQEWQDEIDGYNNVK
jgi:hypothetical protein